MRVRFFNRTPLRGAASRHARDASAVPSPFLRAGAALLSLSFAAGCSARDDSHRAPVRGTGEVGVPAERAAPAEAIPDPASTFEALGARGLSLDAALEEALDAPRVSFAESSRDGELPSTRPGKPPRPWDAFFCNQRPSDTIRLDPADAFSVRTAYWMAWLSLQGYKSRRAGPELRKAGFTRASVIEDRATGLLGFVASTTDFTVVSYSGSADVKDWIHDLTFNQIRDEEWGFPGRFHRGFYKAIQGRWRAILDEAARQSAGRPIYVTGHSLGGAMAFLTAARLADAGLPVASVYTFAAPRVGDDEFATRYEQLLGSRTWRFNNNEDVIPHLGPSAVSAPEFSRLFLGAVSGFMHDFFVEARYSHVGTLLRFDARGVVGVPEPEDLALERAYWRTIYERSDGKNLLQKVLLNWRLAGDHMPAPNFCYLTR